jgi:thiol-disulfide isomerase/thioredoxin
MNESSRARWRLNPLPVLRAAPAVRIAGCVVGMACSARPALPPTPAPGARLAATAPAAPASSVGSEVTSAGRGLEVGQDFIDFGLKALLFPKTEFEAEPVWLSDWIGPKAKTRAPVLVLNFFAAWCEPCFARDLPELRRWSERYQAQGLKILSLNVREPGESVESALAATRTKLSGQAALPFPLLFDRTGRNQRVYLGDTAELPANFVFDTAGRLLVRAHGAGAETLASVERVIVEHLPLGPANPRPPNLDPARPCTADAGACSNLP